MPEDDKRFLRCRGNLLRDRIRHMNRIRGLLNLQGVRRIDPNRSNWETELVNLRTGDDRSFPRQLMNEVRREGKLLSTGMRKEVEAEIAGMIRDERKRRHPAQRGQNIRSQGGSPRFTESGGKPPAYSRQRYSIEGSRIAGKSRAMSA
jgi:transposase